MDTTMDYSITDSKNLDWLKQKLSALWSSPKFCGLCLENNGNFCTIDMEIVINKQEFSRCLRDIISYVFHDDTGNLMSSNYLCDSCMEKIIQSYLFIYNAKQLFKIISNCYSDLNSKVNDIYEQINKTSVFNNANVMIVLESDTDLYNTLIDTKMTEIMPTATPIAMKKVEIKTEIQPKTMKVAKVYNIPKLERPITMKPVKKEITPNITLKEGHLIIRPLNILSNVTPSFNTYKCQSCPEIFTTYRSLKEHEKAKHNKTVYRCNLCDKTYNTQQYLNIHYKIHSKAKCKFCHEILPEENLLGHLRTNHTHLVFPCRFCDLVYYTQDSLVTHFNINHLVNNSKDNSQCVMCMNYIDDDIKKHKCKFACSECTVMPCVHYKYLMSYREQILNHVHSIKCLDCDYVTLRKEHFIGHVNREHLDHHPFTCADCGQQFYTKLSLKTHIAQFHQDFNCIYCDVTFKDTNTLENHKKTCKSVLRAYYCASCPASFDDEEKLVNHDKLRHNDNVLACNLCKSKFLTNIELEEHHARVHSGIQWKKRRKHIECTLCDIMFKNIKELVQHEQLHKSDETYPCKVCSKEFKTLMKLYIHNQSHCTNRIKCNKCNRNVALSFYSQHIVRCPHRQALLTHVCEICGKAFRLESALRFHLKTHTERKKCPQCDKILKQPNLKKHMEHVHGMSKKTLFKIACDLCGHGVSKKTDLEAHMNRYHYKIKPYVCHICSKDFCGKIRLKEHIATHNSDNTCFCAVCGKKFANRVCLKMHFRIHTGELPYTCNICGQKFRSSSIMKTHRLKKHTDKTVSCPLCDNMFYVVRDMRHHFKKVHWKFKDRPFKVTEVEGLSKEHYHLFEDMRLPKIDT